MKLSGTGVTKFSGTGTVRVSNPFSWFYTIEGTHGLYIGDVGKTKNGNRISGWANQQGDAADFIQTTEANQPKLVTNVLNGRTAIQGEHGQRLYMQSGTNSDWNFLHDGTGCSIIIVWKALAGIDTTLRANFITNWGGRVGFHTFYNFERIWIARIRNSDNDDYLLDPTLSTTVTGNTFIQVVSYYFQSGTNDLRYKINDGSIVSVDAKVGQTPPSSATNSDFPLTIMSRPNATGNEHSGYTTFAQVIKHPGEHMSDSLMNEISAKLNEIYGVF